MYYFKVDKELKKLKIADLSRELDRSVIWTVSFSEVVSEVSIMAGHCPNWQAMRMILLTWFDHGF